MNYYFKYLKYKNKYLTLKNNFEGGVNNVEFIVKLEDRRYKTNLNLSIPEIEEYFKEGEFGELIGWLLDKSLSFETYRDKVTSESLISKLRGVVSAIVKGETTLVSNDHLFLHVHGDKAIIIIDLDKIKISDEFARKLHNERMDQIQKSTIRHMARGDCSDPSYPGPSSDEHSSKVLEEIIIKLNEFLKNKLLMDGTLLEGELKNITFFIGARSKIGLWGGIRLYANVDSSEEENNKIIFEAHHIPLNIPINEEDNSDINMLQFLNRLKKIKTEHSDIKFKVVNSICNTCFPIFDYMKNILGFEYMRTIKYNQGHSSASSTPFKKGMGQCLVDHSIFNEKYDKDVLKKIKTNIDDI